MISIAFWQTLLKVTVCQMLQQMTESKKLGDPYFDVSQKSFIPLLKFSIKNYQSIFSLHTSCM
jgi:hypothetical protein